MPCRIAHAMLALALFAALPARADIYTWTDAKGSINVSNIAPPEGAHVTKVVHDSPPRPQAAIDAAEAAHQAEVRALNDRVTQLERDADAAARTPARPPPVYASYYAAAPAPAPQVPAIQYSVYPPESSAQGCDWNWNDCASNTWWTPPIYTAPFFFIPTTGFRHQRPFPGGHFPPPRGPRGPRHPMSVAGVVQPPLGAMGVVNPNTGPVVPRILLPGGLHRN
jgi:uncharacterized protein DUF4124